MKFDSLSNKIIGCALNVHKQLGPGLLENTYKQCIAYELSQIDIGYQIEVNLHVKYKEDHDDCGYRIDMLIENKIILELKCVEKLLPIHEAQILTYMKLSGIKIGLLINFNSRYLRNGIKRFVI